MPPVSFTEKDLLRGKVVDPAWYIMQIEEVGEAPSKDGQSTNYPVSGVIVKNADNGSEEFAGVPIEWNFNSKAMGFAVGFLQAFGIDVKPNVRYDLGAAAGKRIVVHVENDTYQGRLVNRINHKYRSIADAA